MVRYREATQNLTVLGCTPQKKDIHNPCSHSFTARYTYSNTVLTMKNRLHLIHPPSRLSTGAVDVLLS